MIRLLDIHAKYHANLAAERVDVDERHGRRWSLMAIRDSGGPDCSLADSGTMALVRPADLSLPLTQRNVRALAVVLAEAVGLDATQGVVVETFKGRGIGLMLHTDMHHAPFFPERIPALSPDPHVLPGRHVPALATINPNAPDALGHALVACLRAVAEEA